MTANYTTLDEVHALVKAAVYDCIDQPTYLSVRQDLPHLLALAITTDYPKDKLVRVTVTYDRALLQVSGRTVETWVRVRVVSGSGEHSGEILGLDIAELECSKVRELYQLITRCWEVA